VISAKTVLTLLAASVAVATFRRAATAERTPAEQETCSLSGMCPEYAYKRVEVGLTLEAVAEEFASPSVQRRLRQDRLEDLALRRSTELGGHAVPLLFNLDGSEESLRRGIEVLKRARPNHEVRAALARVDRRLIGVRGYALSVPGVDDFASGLLSWRYEVVAIEGTSDFIASPVQQEFQTLLTAFAREYNRGLLGL
jgi:hypothetical protein